jgi:hypothetical protein
MPYNAQKKNTMHLHLRLRQDMLRIPFMTCLPATETLLKSTDAQQALEHIEGAVPNLEFRAREDLLLCASLPDFVEPCREFYAGEGEKLDYTVSESTLERIDAYLVRILQVAMHAHRTAQQVSWAMLR